MRSPVGDMKFVTNGLGEVLDNADRAWPKFANLANGGQCLFGTGATDVADQHRGVAHHR